ncbi:cell wall-binding repeat-containing protein [Mobiluncus sp.]|uniref:cell wall-binding repeat-containing protein n=1 Tax=Mobiluncus sp. TaxID=47293 RepID=UPI002A9194D5|nr:cell wall-binding repeat-containing protein [Mobiluncus sp.]MDY6077651.1 cell wall-binding repeat-containing protein [Mobiluncus sp.]
MSILRRLTVAGTALALTLLGLVFPTMAVAQERAAFPGVIDLPTWIIGGREPIESNASPQDNWVVTGKVVTYLSGERAGATDDNGEELVAGIHVFARYQANNGAWSPIFKTTTTSVETNSKTGRSSNYAIKMRDFVDYNGELGQFRPGEGKVQRLQVWINPEQVPGYRLTFSERTGGVIQGYSTRKDFNWTASQMMQWGFLSVGRNSTQVSQMNIGLIKVAESQEELLGNGVTIEPSLAAPPATGWAAKKKTLQGYVRWENQTLNRGGGNAYVGRANIEDYPVNTPVEGYVVVAAVKNKDNSVEARCTTTKNLSNDDGKTPNWTIYFNNDVDLKNMKFQVFKGTCTQDTVSLQPLPKRMAYWSPFPTAVDSWGTTLNGILGSANQGWTGTRWEDNVRVLLRPLQMQLLPHGESLGTDSGTQSFYGDKVTVDYSRLPLNTPLVAHLYAGTLSDNGSGEPIESKTFTAQGNQGSGSVTFDTELTGDTFKQYWVDVVPKNISQHPEWQVLASQSFLYKPIQLEISKGAANTPGTFTITKKAPADNLVKLTGCQVVSNTDTAAATDSLPYGLKRESTGNGCTLSGTPEKSGVHSLWVKFTFTDKEGKSHTSVQYLPWTVEPRLKPQIEPGTPDSEVSKYSPLEKFPAVGVPYSGLVSPFPDWQGRHFTYQVFDTDPGQSSAALVPGTDGMVSLRNGNTESGLKFNPATGQVTGTTQEHKSAVFWVRATDEDGGVTPAVKYEIYPGSPMILQRAQLPTGSGGSEYQNANGTPIVIWVSGGEPTANELTVSGTTLPRNTYTEAKILKVYDGDNHEVQAGNIGGVKCEIQNNNSGGGQFILCSGTPNVSKATTYYLQVKYTDKNGRTLNGAKYTLPQVKALTTLTGSEGWLKMTLLPQIVADTDPGAGNSADLPDGTKGLSYGPQDVKPYLSGGTGNFANYTFSAAGLPAGLTMDANGVITGKPLETTTPDGVNVKVYLRGKDGTAAERSSTTVTFQLRIKTDLKATTDTLSATAQGGTTYTSNKPLLDVSSAAGISGGVSPYSYKLQYQDGSGSWHDATPSGGRYQVPNADGSASGLLLDSNGKLVGATMGKDSFPQLRVVVTDADMVSCTGGCSVNVGLNLKRVDERRPSVAEGASITANVGETVTGFLPVNDPSGTPQKYEIDTKVLPEGVTLTIDSDTGKYTLTATHEAVAGNSGSVTLKVKGANGLEGNVTLLIHVTDQRIPKTNNNVAIILEQGIRVPDTAKVTEAIDSTQSPVIKCFVPSNYKPTETSGCPSTAQKLPGFDGVSLNPDGTLTGTPVKGDVGEHQVPLKALGVNGKWSTEFSAKITVSPTSLVFEPGIAPGGTTGQAYEWTFNPATGAEGLTKTYQVIGSNGQPVTGCSVNTGGSKPKLTCRDGALTNGETYTLRVSAGTGTAAVSIDRVFTPEIYPPLNFESYILPSAAVGAVYQQKDGSTFRFTAAGGSGSYGFSFPADSKHQKATAPFSCTGWILKTDQGVESGLCLERDGRITGTPKVAGTIDLSKLEVTDSAQHKAGLPAGAKETLVINPQLQLTNLCAKPQSGADYPCQGIKKQPVGTNGKLKIATVSGGAAPYRNLRVEGLDAYNAGVTDPAQQLKADWCGTAPTTNAGGDICLTGTWPKTMVPGSSLNIYVTGAAGRTVTVEAFIPVVTDLKFIDNPSGVPTGVILKQTSGSTQPDNIDQTTWDKVSSKIVSNLPTIGISLDKDAVTGNSLTLPSLVTGGVSPYTYLTVPCDNTDASGNCALGDTGLFLDKSTGELVGTPKPGTSAAVVVSVTDSDSPAQTKKSNLVFSIADTRKPKVTATTINAEVDTAVNQVIPVSDGSGQYASVSDSGKPSWMSLTLTNNVLTVTGKPGPGHVTSAEGGTFSVTVTDKNGNTSEPATITYAVKDNRVPNLSSLTNSSSTDLTGTEGKSVQGWTELPKGTTKYGPKITSWTVEGLPQGVEFDPESGTLSPNKIASGKSGTYPITITATAENGKTTTIVKNLVVTASTLKVAEHDAGNLSKDRDLSNDSATIATVSGGTGSYILVGSVTGLPNTLTATLDSSGNIVLSGTIPDENKDYSVTITVKDSDGVQRTLTRTLHIGKGLSVAKTTMPTATIDKAYEQQCLGVSGGTKPYRISGTPTGVPTGMTIKVENNDVCLSGVPTTGAGNVATATFTLTDNSNPAGSITVTIKIPVNEKFTATEPNPSSHNFYAGNAIIAFTPTEGSGDSCYGLNSSEGCLKADITYSASGLPAGLSINPQTGQISGTPTELVKNRDISVTVASSAPGSNPITKTFSLTVASAFSDPNNDFNVAPSTTVPELDANGTVKTDNSSNQVLPVPEIKNANGDTVATGKYSIENVQPDSQGNYPLGKSGLALTPDGKLVGTLKPGQPNTPGTNGTFNLGDYPVVLNDNAGGGQIGPKTVAFTVTDTRTPQITVNSATVEVGQAADISMGVTGGSGKIDTVSLSGCNNLSVAEGKIHVPENAFSEGTRVTCQVTVKDYNGKSVNSTLTISVNDSRQPKFNTNERERYAWQGLDFTHVTLGNNSEPGIPVMTWLVDPATDPTAAPLKSVKIAGLPDKFKVMLGNNEADKDNDGVYTCDTPADCTIVGYAAKDVTGVKDFTLTITADTQNSEGQATNLTASKSIPLRVFASPLQLNTSTPNGMIRATNGSYTSTVGTVDYRGTITSTTQAGDALLHNDSAWDGTYALDNNADYQIVKVTAYNRDGSNAEVASHGLTLTATPASPAAMPKGDQAKKAQTLTLKSTNTGTIPEGTTSLAVELKLTDGHGIVRSATVNIPVVQKLEWAGPPFNSAADPVKLGTVGVPGAPYPAYYAEAKGGDGSLSTSLADATTNITTAVEADAKAKFNGRTGYQGIPPVYCAAQGTIESDTRPKCFPIPDLGGTIPANAWNNPVPANYKGLFMLSNGKLSGSIPENVTAGTYPAQVLVIDGSGQLIKKTFSITVEQKLTLTLPNNKLPDGKRGICYGSTTGEKPNNGTCSVSKEVGTYDGPDDITATCELIPPVDGLAVTCTGGTVTISGAPTQTYDGNATVKVTLTGGAGQSVEKTLPLLIETDLIFQNSDNVKVETDPDGTQKIEVNTTANGKDLPKMKLEVTGGVTEGEDSYTYYVEDKGGNRVSPVPCPAGVTSTTSKPIVCYPIGTTGLVLDSEGNIHGTPNPGGSAEGNFVVADSDTTPRTKKAAITVNIADKRPPQVYDLTINTTVGATSLSGSTQLVAEDPQNPPVNTSTLPSEQQTAAGKHGFSTIKPTGALGTPDECSVTDSMPGWLTLGTDGVISLASNQKVPVNAAGEPHKFCVWYVGPNGANAPKPAVVSVNVTDQRRVTIDGGNGDTTDAEIGAPVSPDPATLVEARIPADLVNSPTKPLVTKLNPDGTACTGTICKFTSTGTSFTDESIDGLTVTGLNCTGTGNDPRSCSIAVSGTPTPSAAGDHQLSYRITLPNGQTQIISHTLHIPPYDLALSLEPMNPAVVGLDYLQISKPVLAQGGSRSYWFQLWDPKHPVDDASASNNTAKVGDMDLVTTGNQVKLQWKPTDADLAKASGGNIPVTITVWDKTACQMNSNGPGENKPGPADCLYKVTKTVNIPLHAAPVTTDITVPEVTEGTSTSSSPVYTGNGKAELSGTIAPGNEHLFTFDPNSGVVTLKDTARPGTYTAVIRVTLPGVAIPFYRNVTFTVKEKPVPEPTNPTPSATPEPRPGVAPLSPSTGITYPARDLDTLVVRHGGNDRIGTSLAVLDFFSAKSSTPTEANNLVVAYADYAGKVSLPWSDTAVLVRDDDYPDALVAGPLAANYNAPILMTPTKQVPHRVVDALRTYGFTKVILVGNSGAISAGAASQLQNAGFQVQRLGGQDRYRTAGAVADHLLAARGRDKSDVYLATGVDYPDALSASSAAIKNVGVVLLTPRRTVDGTSQGWMNSAKAAKVVAVGGPAVAAAEKSVHLDEKQVGVDRYETAEKVASAYFPPNPGRIAVATGKDFPDATLAASLTARTGSPLVLTRPDTLTKPTTQFLTRNRASVRKVDVVGGKAAVTEKVRGEIYSALR